MPRTHPGPTLPADFGRLWAAYAASEVGSALAIGALPLVAILVLHVADWQVSVLTAVSGIGAALVALPIGPYVEHRSKRAVMVAADLARAGVLLSVPVCAWLGVLTFAQLCVVGLLQTTALIAFNAASGAHLRSLVGSSALVRAQGRLDATLWTAQIVGNPLGGALVAGIGALVTVVVDACSYLASALLVRSIRAAEPEPPARREGHGRLRAVVEGWRVIRATPGVDALFVNSLVFGACVMAVSPLLPLLVLREMGLGAWAYGLALGAGSVGGLMGSAISSRLVERYGRRQVLLTSGVVRHLWLLLLPVAPSGAAGLVVVTVAELGLLASAGIFNPVFAAYRLTETPEDALARVTTAWAISQRVVQPLGIAAGGALVAVFDVRVALAAAAVALLAATPLLPWRSATD